MGLFKKKKRMSDKGDEVTKKAYYESDWEKCKQFVEDKCEIMLKSSLQLETAKQEYEEVTEAFTDIQLLDELEPEVFAEIRDLAEEIVELGNEREEVKNGAKKMSESDYQHMMSIESDFFKLHTRMEEDEEYCKSVRSDMYYLESEKGSLKFERDEEEEKLSVIRTAAKVTAILFAVAVFVLAVAVFGFAFDVIVVGSIIFLVAAVAVVIILCMYQNTLYKIKLAEKKLSRAITLLNSAKIRYVNITNSLDSQYIKHNVKSSEDFMSLYERYQEVREERQRFSRMSSQLNSVENRLIELLIQAQLKDPNVWIYQAGALADEREMVEIRHDLNTKRQQLRKQMEVNAMEVEDAKEQIVEFARINGRYADDITEVVNIYTRQKSS